VGWWSAHSLAALLSRAPAPDFSCSLSRLLTNLDARSSITHRILAESHCTWQVTHRLQNVGRERKRLRDRSTKAVWRGGRAGRTLCDELRGKSVRSPRAARQHSRCENERRGGGMRAPRRSRRAAGVKTSLLSLSPCEVIVRSSKDPFLSILQPAGTCRIFSVLQKK